MAGKEATMLSDEEANTKNHEKGKNRHKEQPSMKIQQETRGYLST